MKIAIIGAGNVGGILGRGWPAVGHEVVFGVRDPKDPRVVELLEGAKGRARAATLREAAGAGDIIVFATLCLPLGRRLRHRELEWEDRHRRDEPPEARLVRAGDRALATSAAEQIAGWRAARGSSGPSTRSGRST